MERDPEIPLFHLISHRLNEKNGWNVRSIDVLPDTFGLESVFPLNHLTKISLSITMFDLRFHKRHSARFFGTIQLGEEASLAAINNPIGMDDWA